MFIQKVLHVVIVAVNIIPFPVVNNNPEHRSVYLHDSDICLLRNVSLFQELKTKGAFHK